jgi:phosphate transport system protein
MSPSHTAHAYDRDLARLDELVLGMGLFGVSQLERAVSALEKRDGAIAASVVAGDIREDSLATEADELAARLIALRQPEASDLRQVVCALKTTVHLERIGDYAVHIAKRSLALVGEGVEKELFSIPEMGTQTLQMLGDTMQAYRDKDQDLAVKIWRSDEALDVHKDRLLRQILTAMKDNPEWIDRGVHLMSIAKNLERVGDQATNICELLYYRLSGDRLPHRPHGRGIPMPVPAEK